MARRGGQAWPAQGWPGRGHRDNRCSDTWWGWGAEGGVSAVLAAVDVELGAGDVGGLLGDEEEDGVGDPGIWWSMV